MRRESDLGVDHGTSCTQVVGRGPCRRRQDHPTHATPSSISFIHHPHHHHDPHQRHRMVSQGQGEGEKDTDPSPMTVVMFLSLQRVSKQHILPDSPLSIVQSFNTTYLLSGLSAARQSCENEMRDERERTLEGQDGAVEAGAGDDREKALGQQVERPVVLVHIEPR